MWITWKDKCLNTNILQTIQLETNNDNLLEIVGYSAKERFVLLENTNDTKYRTEVLEKVLRDIVMSAQHTWAYGMSRGVARVIDASEAVQSLEQE